jgi:hypothetical protein
VRGLNRRSCEVGLEVVFCCAHSRPSTFYFPSRVFLQEASGTLNAGAGGTGGGGEITEVLLNLSGEEQGSDAWHALRATRLTASAFSNACGGAVQVESS